MKAKDPAVLFYTSDFLGGVALMSMKERGQYITLLCLQRERGHLSKQEITRAVGKLSEEVASKFVQDQDGKYYNQRMEKETQKREHYNTVQRERVQKRWNQKKVVDGATCGSTHGNTMEDTVVSSVVLPLGNGNGTTSSPSMSSSSEKEKTLLAREAFSRVVSAYANKVNPNMSDICLGELNGFFNSMGEDCCLRAIDIAVDEGASRWSFVKNVLKARFDAGVRSLADWKRYDTEWEAKRKRGQQDGSSDNYWTK